MFKKNDVTGHSFASIYADQEKRVQKETGTYVFAHNVPFLKKFFKSTIRKNRKMRDKLAGFSFYIKHLEHSGSKIINYTNTNISPSESKLNEQRIMGNMLNNFLPNCHELTKQYILAGYSLNENWETEILNLLKDDRVIFLDDELIFILFSTKMSVDEFLELSDLPKSYLAKLLPTGVDI